MRGHPSVLPRPEWLTNLGPEGDVAISTRARLARNVRGHVFPWRASHENAERVLSTVLPALTGTTVRAAQFFRSDTDADTLANLTAWRYASLPWVDQTSPGVVHIAADRPVSAMVNEEDHLRLQCVVAGMDVSRAERGVREWDAELGKRLDYAHDSHFGYLTASLSNAGTGLRVGVLLHLAAAATRPDFVEILDAAVRTGCAVRGAFGEGTGGTGSLYQVSNTQTHGETAAHSVGRASAAARYLVKVERQARTELFGSRAGRHDLADAAEGARQRIFSEELAPGDLLRLLSVMRLAIAVGATEGALLRSVEWIALAGAWTTSEARSGSERVRFEAVRRMAEIRASLR